MAMARISLLLLCTALFFCAAMDRITASPPGRGRQSSGAELPMQLVERLNLAARECNAPPVVGFTVLGCAAGFRGTSRFGGPGFVDDANYLLGCFDPYKRLLEGCSTYSARDNDLALLDTFKLAIADNGALVTEISTHNFQAGNCRNPAENARFGQVMRACFRETGLDQLIGSTSANLNAIQIAGRFCSDFSSLKTCMVKGRDSNPCAESLREINYILSIFDKLEDNAEHKDVMRRCING